MSDTDTEILKDMVKYISWVKSGNYLNKETDRVTIYRPLYQSILKRFTDNSDYYTLEKKNELTLKANNSVNEQSKIREISLRIETITKTLLEKLKFEFNLKNTSNQIKKIMYQQRIDSFIQQINDMKNRVDPIIFNNAELMSQEMFAVLLLRIFKLQKTTNAQNIVQKRINEIYASNPTYFSVEKQTQIKNKSEDTNFVIPEYFSNDGDNNIIGIGVM